LKDRITAFHTIARRYLIGILNDFKDRKMEISGLYNKIYKKNNGDHRRTDDEFEKDITVKILMNELNTQYPNWVIREKILKVILIKIESRTAEEFDSFSEIKEFVLNECNESKIDERYSFGTSNEKKIEICNEEKKKFYDFIDSIDEEVLTNIEPLFYRRVLPKSKISEIKRKIDEVCYRNDSANEACLCFKEEDFRMAVKINEIISILSNHNVHKIYEINTGGIDTASYIMDLSEFNPYFIDGFNIYWCSNQMDWIIIKDHEGYYFIYGEWITEELKAIWKEWDTKLIAIN
jgi:hypothetical protein